MNKYREDGFFKMRFVNYNVMKNNNMISFKYVYLCDANIASFEAKCRELL